MTKNEEEKSKLAESTMIGIIATMIAFPYLSHVLDKLEPTQVKIKCPDCLKGDLVHYHIQNSHYWFCENLVASCNQPHCGFHFNSKKHPDPDLMHRSVWRISLRPDHF